MLPPAEHFWPELQVQTSRSSGPGGQNVNKVESRVELRFARGLVATANRRAKADATSEKLEKQLTAEGYVLITAQEDRSQLRNKEIALQKFHDLLKRSPAQA